MHFVVCACVVSLSLYDKFGSVAEVSEDMVTECIEKSPFAITALSVDASSRNNHSEYPHNSYHSVARLPRVSA